MAETNRIEDLANATAYDVDGEKLGGVKDVYVNDTTGQPDFVSVNHGMFVAATPSFRCAATPSATASCTSHSRRTALRTPRSWTRTATSPPKTRTRSTATTAWRAPRT